MGSKLLCNLISGNSTWSKQVLWKKYFHGHWIRCLNLPPKVQRGSLIFSLCLRSLDHFKTRLSWIPRNGKLISILEDSILGDLPIYHQTGLTNIKTYLQSNNHLTLWDISWWDDDEDRCWIGWDLGNYPERLEDESKSLLEFLQWKSPIKAPSKVKRGRGSSTGKYSAVAGYKSL